jgi:plasmid stabilization system protein ParE
LTVNVRLSDRAARDLERLPAFLAPKSGRAAEQARLTILQAIRSLSEFPNRGRPGGGATWRELAVDFGRDAYFLRYRVRGDEVLVTRIKHSRERR